MFTYNFFAPNILLAAHTTGNHLPCCEDDFPTLYLKHPGLRGEAVREIQDALAILGYYAGEPSGVYEEKTLQAVISFQKKTGLAPDGVVKYHVWLKLAHEVEKTVATNKLPPPAGEVSIVIDTFRRRLMVFNDQVYYAQFPIAIGKSKTPSPIGNWTIVTKGINKAEYLGTRWLGLNVPWGTYGIHGTDKPWSIGSLASLGCFRMFNKDVEIIYPWVKTGTSVTVIGNPFSYTSGGFQSLSQGSASSGVIYIQQKLNRLGFYPGKPDGRLGPATAKAVKDFQLFYGLERTGQLGVKEYETMGLIFKK